MQNKKAPWFIAVILLAVTLVSVAAAAFLGSVRFTEEVGQKISSIASDALKTKVEIGSAAIENINSIGIKNVSVYDKSGDSIVQAEYAQVELSLFGMLAENPLDGINAVNVSGVKADIVQREDGSFNFEDLISDEPSKNDYHGKVHVQDAVANVLYDAKEIQIDDIRADVDFANYPALHVEGTAENQEALISINANTGETEQSVTVEAENIAIENYLQYVPEGMIPDDVVTDISGRLDKVKFTGIKIGEDLYYSGEIMLSDGQAVIMDSKVEDVKGLFVFNEKQSLVFLRASCNGQEAMAHGKVRLDTSTPILDITVSTSNFEPSKILTDIDYEGAVTASARVTGPVNAPVVDGELEVPQGRVAGYDFSALTAKVHYADNKVYAKDLSVNIAGGNVGGEAEFNAVEYSFVAHLKLDSVQLSDFSDVLPNVSGKVTGDVAVEGKADELENMKVYGSVSAYDVAYRALDMESAHTSFAKVGNNITIDFLSMDMRNGGKLGLEGNVILNETIDFTFYGGNMDLSRFEPIIPNVPMAGRADVQGTIKGDFFNPIIRADFAAWKGHIYHQPFDRLKGYVAGSMRGMMLKDFTMEYGDKNKWIIDGKMGIRDMSRASKGVFSDFTADNFGLNIRVDTIGSRLEDIVQAVAPGTPLTGNLDNTITVTGTLADPKVEGFVHCYTCSYDGIFLQGMDGDYFVDSVVGADGVKHQVVTLKDFNIQSPWLDVDLNGTLTDMKDLDMFVETHRFTADNFRNRLPYPVDGTVVFSGALTGKVDDPLFEGYLTAQGINVNGEDVTDVRGNVVYYNNHITVNDLGFTQNGGSYDMDASVNLLNGVLKGSMEVKDADISAILTMANQKNDTISGRINGTIGFGGTTDRPEVSGRIYMTDGMAGGYAIRNVEANASLLNNVLTIRKLEGYEGMEGKFAAEGTVDLSGPISMRASVSDIDVGMITKVCGIKTEIQGKLNGDVQALGTVSDPEADVSLNIYKAGIPGTTVDSVSALLHLRDNVVTVEQMVLDKNVNGQDYRGIVKGTIPLDSLSEDESIAKNSSMNLLVDLNEAELSVLPGLTNYIEWAVGDMDGEIRITGNRYQPAIDGHIGFNEGAMKIKGITIPVTDMSALIAFRGDRAVIDHFDGVMGSGRYSANGYIKLNGNEIDDYNINLHSDKLEVDSDCYKGPFDLKLNISKVNVDRIAEIVFRDSDMTEEEIAARVAKWPPMPDMPLISGKLYLEDVILSNPPLDDSESEFPNMAFDFDVELGKNVRFYNPQMANLQLAGSAHIGGSMKHPMTRGNIYVKKGTVSYLKTVFTVREGNLAFGQPGTLIPRLRFNADTMISRTKVIIDIDGQLYGADKDNAIKTTLTSVPSMSQNDIVMLLTLRSNYKENGESKFTVGDVMSIGLQMTILGEVEAAMKNTLGLDLLSIERSTSTSLHDDQEEDHEGIEVQFGKYITNGLMVKYVQGIGDNTYKYSVEYDLSDNVNFSVMRNDENETIFGVQAKMTF